MQFQPSELNRMTLLKAVASLVIIISVLIVGAVSVWFSAQSAAYDAALGAYVGWNENLCEKVKSRAAENNIGFGSLDAASAETLFGGDYNGFNGALVVTEAGGGRIIYSSSDVFADNIGSYGVTLPEEGTEVFEVGAGGKYYAVAATGLGEGMYLCGYMDFTASVQAFSGFKTAVIAVFTVSAVLIIGAFAAYVILTGINERGHKYRYKLQTDSEGRILKSNKNFKQDFPQTVRIYDNVAHFDEGKLNAIKLNSFEDEQFLACAAKRTTSGKIKISADALGMPYNAQATQPREMMREMYVSLLPRGKAFLLGIIFIANLHNIKDMFGRDFAEDVHHIIYEKIAKRFKYIYDLDIYNIGVIFPNGKEYEVLMQDLKDIVADLNQYIKIENNVVNMSVKCGFAVCDNTMEQRSFEYAMTAADAALTRTEKEKLKNYYIFRGSEIKQFAKYFFNYDLRQMLKDNLFEMEYQPQYSIAEQRVVGFEALFRVKKSANLAVNIFDLISYAERSGNMMVIGDFIFNTAMSFAKRLENKDIKLSLNVSPVQLMQAGFCDNFLEIYDQYDLKPGSLCVEITESFLVQNFDDAVQKLEVLREHGIEIHLDDFGTRYSSLLYLKKLPVSVIKIDREFVIDIGSNDFDKSITSMIVNICKEQNLMSISEGVETREQYDILKSIGVDIIQGWLIGKSMPADAALKFADEFKLK